MYRYKMPGAARHRAQRTAWQESERTSSRGKYQRIRSRPAARAQQEHCQVLGAETTTRDSQQGRKGAFVDQLRRAGTAPGAAQSSTGRTGRTQPPRTGRKNHPFFGRTTKNRTKTTKEPPTTGRKTGRKTTHNHPENHRSGAARRTPGAARPPAGRSERSTAAAFFSCRSERHPPNF